MGNYKSATDAAKGSPNLEALQYLQENWGASEISASLRVEVINITTDATGGQTTTNIPVGAEIVDIVVCSAATNAGGTVTASIGGGGAAISDAIAMAVIDVRAAAGTIDRTYKIVTAAGITVTTNGAADFGDVYVYYKK